MTQVTQGSLFFTSLDPAPEETYIYISCIYNSILYIYIYIFLNISSKKNICHQFRSNVLISSPISDLLIILILSISTMFLLREINYILHKNILKKTPGSIDCSELCI